MKGGTKKIVIIKVNYGMTRATVDNLRNAFFEQAKTGLVIVDKYTDIYNIEVQDDIEATEVKVEIAGGENE